MDAAPMAVSQPQRILAGRIERRLRERCEAMGRPDAAVDIETTPNRNGGLDVVHRLHEGVDGGGHLGTLFCDTDEHWVEDIAERAARKAVRARTRIDAVGPSAGEPWTLTTHALVKGWLEARDIQPERLDPEHPINRDGGLTTLTNHKGMILTRIARMDGRISLTSIDERDGSFRFEPDDLRIRCSRVLPATIVQALPGRWLHEVIDHPVVRRSDPIRITEARTEQEMLVLDVEDVQVPLGDPPPNADMRWITMAA